MDQWTQMLRQFEKWGSPLRPCPEDVQMYKKQLKKKDKVLLLGVTPELMPLANIAVDHNPHAVKIGGDKAMLCDWTDLPFEQEFDAAIGDGCLTVFQQPPECFFEQIKKALKPEGRLILRLFISPETKEQLPDILKSKEMTGFHAFKWRVAHALANPYISVQEIYQTILPVWDHPTLDVYRNSPLVYYFPKLSELPVWTQIEFGSSYELAERCPVVTWEMNSSNLPGGNSAIRMNSIANG